MKLDPDDPITPYIEKMWANVRYYWFPSVDEIIDLCSKDRRHYRDSSPFRIIEADENSWFGCRDMPTSLKQFRFGMQAAVETVDLTDAALAIPRPIENSFATFSDTSGGSVNMDAYIAGLPEDMIQHQPAKHLKKTVKLLFNVSASGGTSGKELMKRGLLVVSIIDWLERSGYRVRVDVCDTIIDGWGENDPDNPVWMLAFCAKDFAQSADISRLAYMLGSPDMLRRIFFGVEDLSTDFRRIWKGNNNYGAVCKVPQTLQADYDYIFDYGTPVTLETATQCIDYITSGKNEVYRPDDHRELIVMMQYHQKTPEDWSHLKCISETLTKDGPALFVPEQSIEDLTK